MGVGIIFLVTELHVKYVRSCKQDVIAKINLAILNHRS